MTDSYTREVAEMIANPHDHFLTPEEVLGADRLHSRDKLAILQTMELDANELVVATAENMAGPGDGAEELKRVRDAIRRLRVNGERMHGET